VACGDGDPMIIIKCTIPFAKYFIWRAKPLIEGNNKVGINRPLWQLKRNFELEYEYLGISYIKFVLSDFFLQNVTFINLECMSDDPSIESTSYSLSMEICKYNLCID